MPTCSTAVRGAADGLLFRWYDAGAYTWPVLGGIITGSLDWRWVLGLVASLVVSSLPRAGDKVLTRYLRLAKQL